MLLAFIEIPAHKQERVTAWRLVIARGLPDHSLSENCEGRRFLRPHPHECLSKNVSYRAGA
jgi:hypothetical protein